MNSDRNSRRSFLRTMASVAATGSATALFPQLGMMGTALASTRTLTGYKALVCINLAGGNDSWNMLVPSDTARFNIYAAARGGVFSTSNTSGLALDRPSGGQIAIQGITDGNDTNSSTNQYFLHPSLDDLGSIYRSGKLAFVTNVGTLVRPITKANYNSSVSNRPAQLFSHSDQSDQWGQGATLARTQGWGGMMGDIVRTSNSNTLLSPCISIAGSSRFLTGVVSTPYQMNSSGLSILYGACNPGTTCWPGNEARNNAVNEMIAATYANDFTKEYARTFKRARDIHQDLASGLAGTQLTTDANFGNNNIAKQLRMVALMIKLSKANGLAARQIYYVNMGGYDMHDKLMGTDPAAHAALLTQLSDALAAFQTAMGSTDVNAANEVTTFSSSEFARTLSSNGDGSDHAWGGVQLVMGGAVQGGKLYSNGGGPITGFPDQTLNSLTSFARGQCIPGIGVEQFGATLARWMGITTPELPSIFPNISNFNSSDLGFL